MTESERIDGQAASTGDRLPERAMLVYQLLGEVYGIKPWKPRRDPMHELISTILSHRTTQANEAKAFDRLWRTYGSWQAICDAPVEGIAEAIAPANWPEQKAPRIKAVLKQIVSEHGAPSIDFLADLPAEQGLAWLQTLPGVGPKTAALVLLFCFHKPVMPVDTHVHRVSQRIGLIGPRATAEQAHHLLLDLLPRDADVLWNFHLNMLRHGQKICVWGTPRCERCILREHCDYARSREGERREASGERQ